MLNLINKSPCRATVIACSRLIDVYLIYLTHNMNGELLGIFSRVCFVESW